MKAASVETLVVLGRAPGTGGPRSKLARELGDLEAARLDAAFLMDTMALAASWRRRATGLELRNVALYVPDSLDDALLQELAGPAGARVVAQSGGDAGEVLFNALTDELDRGAQRVMAMGCNTPTLPLQLLDEALRAVLFHDVVLGPTFGGGLWGVAVRRDDGTAPAKEAAALHALLDKLPWGQHGSLPQTLERLNRAGLGTHLLPYWLDVLEPGDLHGLKTNLRYQELRASPAGGVTRAALQNQPPPAAALPRISRRA